MSSKKQGITGQEPRLSRVGTPSRLTNLPSLGGYVGVMHLAEHLNDPDPQVRERALFELARQGNDEALDGLLEIIQNELDTRRRDRAIRALGLLGDPRAALPLIEYVLGSTYMTASEEAAAVALKRICGVHPEVIDNIVPHLMAHVSLDYGNGGAALMLGEIGDIRAIEPLVAALASPSFYNWRYGVYALGMIGKKHADAAPHILDVLLRHGLDERRGIIAVQFLIEAMTIIGLQYESLAGQVVDTLVEKFLTPGQPADYYHHGYWAAVRALGRIGSRHTCMTQVVIDVLAAMLGQSWTQDVALVLSGIRDERATEVLRQALVTCEPDRRTSLAVALARKGVIEPLLEVLNDPYPQGIFIEALGASGNPHAVTPLIGLLTSNNHLVRSLAARALGNLHDPQAVQPLVEVLVDRRRDVRRAAAQALNKIERVHRGATEPAVPALITLLSDSVRSVQDAAAKALGRIQTAEAQEAVWRWRFPDAQMGK